jgi:predicted DNA-binding protein (MmcQ/YjbR family)
VRARCLAHDGVTERVSHGEAAWFAANGRQFATSADRHHDDRRALWIAAPAGAQEALIEGAPERFFRPPYVGHRGWVGVYLDVPVDWDELDALIDDAYAAVSTARRTR